MHRRSGYRNTRTDTRRERVVDSSLRSPCRLLRMAKPPSPRGLGYTGDPNWANLVGLLPRMPITSPIHEWPTLAFRIKMSQDGQYDGHFTARTLEARAHECVADP